MINENKKMTHKFSARILGGHSILYYKKMGIHVGENFNYGNGYSFDISHCWLVKIGNNCTFSSDVHILAHDVSTKQHIGYAKVGGVTICDNVFIGTGSTVLPVVHIGKNL